MGPVKWVKCEVYTISKITRMVKKLRSGHVPLSEKSSDKRRGELNNIDADRTARGSDCSIRLDSLLLLLLLDSMAGLPPSSFVSYVLPHH